MTRTEVRAVATAVFAAMAEGSNSVDALASRAAELYVDPSGAVVTPAAVAAAIPAAPPVAK